ncbi:MAG TPA: hypothetical protein VMR86_20090, partial [Myxococcota bacterium]|nr:hypothetical protein [Myxococcota bacterium]
RETRRMRIGPGRALPLLLLCAGCFGGAPAAPPANAPPDADIAAFSTRIQGFYSALEDVPLDALVTYQNKHLSDCFETPGAFSDYFSALATEARHQHFRDMTARAVRVRKFDFTNPDEALVEVAFTSVHQRALRFWSIGFDRLDTWHRIDGIWRIVPAKL